MGHCLGNFVLEWEQKRMEVGKAGNLGSVFVTVSWTGSCSAMTCKCGEQIAVQPLICRLWGSVGC